MDSVTLKKIKSVNFMKSSHEFDNTSSFSIIFQRFYKFKIMFSLCCVCNIFSLCFGTNIKKGGDDNLDVIEIERKPHFLVFNEIFDNNDPESGSFIDDLNKLDNVIEITDVDFRNACEKASLSCNRFAKIFITGELFTKFCDVFLICMLSLFHDFSISKSGIIAILTICVPIIVLQVVFDWGKLSEKYQRLSCEFSDLANSKADDRVDKYQKYVNTFKSGFVYTDMILPI